MLPAIFFTLALVMIFPATLIAGKTELGGMRPLLSIAFVVMFFLFLMEAVVAMRHPPDEEPTGNPHRKGRRR